MKRIILSAFLLSAVYAQAQTKEEISKIVSRTNVKALEELGKQANKEFEERQNRIAEYLVNNPTAQIKYVGKNGGNFEMYDVVDGEPMYITNENLSAAQGIGVSHLRSDGSLGLNLEGQNMFSAVFDEGYALYNHVEFYDSDGNSRLTFPDTPIAMPASNSHGTHVSGTVAALGVNISAMGMAPKSLLRSVNWGNDLNKLTMYAANGLLLSNHSYGVPVTSDSGVTQNASVMGTYGSQARQFDLVMNAAPYYLHVVSAGNSGMQSYTGGTAPSFDKLTQEKVAKNNLVVANANPTVNLAGTITSVMINNSSSQGPADDGRVKPDIAGDGTNVFSTNNENTTSYATFSGTSMASPGIMGASLLLQQYHNQLVGEYMYSHTLRGLILHTAYDVAMPGPDARFGWGLADYKKAAETLRSAKSDEGDGTAMIIEDELVNGEFKEYEIVASGDETLKVSIVWNDPAGFSQQGTINSTTPALVNDLDVRVTQTTDTFLPYRLKMDTIAILPNEKGDNTVDNFERVDVSTPSGTYKIRVDHKGTLAENQKFTLIVTGVAPQMSTGGYEYVDVSVYPNPVKDNLIVTTGATEVTLLEVFDIQGRKVKSTELAANGSFVTNMDNMASGVYVVKITGSKGVMTKKIVKS